MYFKMIFVVIFLSCISMAQSLPAGIELTAAGKFKQLTDHNVISANGLFSCTYRIASAGDEVRELKDFTFYNSNVPVYTLEDIPGSDLYISNSGIAAFIDHTYHYLNLIKIIFCSPQGIKISEMEFTAAYLFGFSDDGNVMGIGTPGKLTLVYTNQNKIEEYPGCMEFGVEGKYVVTADKEKVSLYAGAKLLNSIGTQSYVRKILMLDNSYCFITRDEFLIRSLLDNSLRYRQQAPAGFTFTDLILKEGKIFTGLSKKENGSLSAYVAEYRDNALSSPKLINNKITEVKSEPELVKDSLYEPVPWPFAPFDSMRTAWNHYEQNMGSYIHQGLDLIVPINEPAYTVQQGFVKCVLTIGGDSYWRVAVSPVQDSGRSDGWLYAHLVESSIPVFPGDTVDIHEYLGNIIIWSDDWGHIHFVQINDSGAVWLYEDDEWGINFNPYFALQPVNDTIPPVIVNSMGSQKFEFCKNETPGSQTRIYLDPDSLYGEIDIITKVIDYIGDSEYQQPAVKSYYWIRRIADDSIVVPRRLGHILDHKYSLYESSHFTTYASVLYIRDALHPWFGWSTPERNYWHIITNDDGDKVLDSLERFNALDTRMFYDGSYRIYVEVFDASGNSALDSMDVSFINGITAAEPEGWSIQEFELDQNYPNPFNPSTVIRFNLPSAGRVLLELYNIMGEKTAILSEGYMEKGSHVLNFDSRSFNLASGVYLYKLSCREYSAVKKLLLLK